MEARRLTLDLLARRADNGTICPSEAARALAAWNGDPAGWRAAMSAVHEAVDLMLAHGEVIVSWKGEPLPARNGPYRIGRADHASPAIDAFGPKEIS